MKENNKTCLPAQDDNVILQDVNQIQVSIPNKRIPIVIPYGPQACGKTMMIFRLCKYLLKRGYHIKPVRDFRPVSDKYYQDCCEQFEKYLHNAETAISTNPLGFILIEISDKNGGPICYLFDAEGNCYFDPFISQTSYPTFINYIICSPNPKQYIFFVEPNWEDIQTRNSYVRHIADFQRHCNRRKDKQIILYNKIDKCPLYITPTGYVDKRIAAMDCQNQFAGLFDIFRQRNPIIRWLQPYIFKFIPFSSGFFYQDVSGIYKYEAGIDLYPQLLWQAITK